MNISIFTLFFYVALFSSTKEAADYGCFSTSYTTYDRLKSAANIKLYKNVDKYEAVVSMFNLQTQSILAIGKVGSVCSTTSTIKNSPTIDTNSYTIVNATVYPTALGEAEFKANITVNYDLSNVTCAIYYQNANSTVSEVSCGYLVVSGKYLNYALTLLIVIAIII